MTESVLKIGIFYDGHYLYHVSNYYAYRHEIRARLSISGLHLFVRDYISKRENAPLALCQIVDAHYFRGRYPTPIIEQKGWLKGERQFEDVLMYNGVTTHYWPMQEGSEKSIDVALALEAYELTQLKHYDVCVLVAGDGDYAPLVRKLNMTGTRVMILGWDFDFVDERNVRRETRVSRALLADATYPLFMTEIIRTGSHHPGSPLSLFVTKASDPDLEAIPRHDKPENTQEIAAVHAQQGPLFGHIILLNQGWGFIAPENGDVDVFFCRADLLNTTFDALRHRDRVQFEPGHNDKGPIAKKVTLL